MSTREAPRARDVAQVAGVSVGTVSNVLNHPERVSPLIQTRVLAVIRELGFVPNEAARSLRMGTDYRKAVATDDEPDR